MSDAIAHRHSHVFLGEGHERSERRTWAVIGLCAAMMIAEIVGGTATGIRTVTMKTTSTTTPIISSRAAAWLAERTEITTCGPLSSM
jgi:hypothetical protein